MKKKIPNTVNPEAVVTGTYETEIEFTCPVRGVVKQKVLVKKYKNVDNQVVSDPLPSKSIADKLDRKFSGLTLVDDTIDPVDEEV